MPLRYSRDPFRPLVGLVVLLVAVMGVLVLSDVADVATWHDAAPNRTTYGAYNCVDVQGQTPWPASTNVPGAPPTKPNATAITGTTQVCLPRPDRAQRAIMAVHELGDHLIALGLLVLVLLCIRSGRREGIFTVTLAQRVQRLGWAALAASVLWPFLAAACVGVVMQAALIGATWTDALRHPELSWYAVVAALGIITVARVLRHGVVLQTEVDETV